VIQFSEATQRGTALVEGTAVCIPVVPLFLVNTFVIPATVFTAFKASGALHYSKFSV
jgi:hypothetical protein